MIIHVRLLQYASKIFTYAVPDTLQHDIAVGVLVQVPLGNRVTSAVVESIELSHKIYKFEIKNIITVYPFPKDFVYQQFLQQVSGYYQVDPLVLLRRVQLFLTEQNSIDYVPRIDQEINKEVVILNQQQQDAYDHIVPFVWEQKHDVFLLHGVTGSGKTEVYKKLVELVVAQGKAAMLLFPEVTLALRFEKIFAAYFQQVPVIGFHSASTAKQKKQLWQNLLEQKPVIIIGVHLPVLLPIAHLGIVIVDEEHDHGYQEKKHPKMHSRDIAILRAYLYKVPIILGSATPSIQSLWNVAHRGWKLLQMTQRYAGNFPTVKLVSLKKGVARKHPWIHNELYFAIQDRLEKKEQVIIFLNRRGYSFFVQCPCSFVFTCGQCSVSLTLHQSNILMCHYCGYQEPLAQKCPTCQGVESDFMKKGIGTQQLVSILQKLFSSARIARADLDTTSKKRSWNNTVEDMYDGNIDILVGTQSITKGYHFPKVTLVGVLWADLNLHFPIYNAAEVTLQQLIQVAGRAGRQSDDSLVVIQSFDQHEIFNYINESSYLKYYEYEITNRVQAQYPPSGHIAEIEFKSDDQKIVMQDAIMIAKTMRELCLQKQYSVDVFGPLQSLVYKVKGTYTQKLFLKSDSRVQLINVFQQIKHTSIRSSMFFSIDPVA